MEPIFNKKEKIETLIKIWSRTAIINLLFALFYSFLLKQSTTENVIDYIYFFMIFYCILKSVEAVYERQQWVDALNNNFTDDFFDL